MSYAPSKIVPSPMYSSSNKYSPATTPAPATPFYYNKYFIGGCIAIAIVIIVLVLMFGQQKSSEPFENKDESEEDHKKRVEEHIKKMKASEDDYKKRMEEHLKTMNESEKKYIQ